MTSLLHNWLHNGKRDTGGIALVLAYLLQSAGIADADQAQVIAVWGAAMHVIGWVHFLFKKYFMVG